MPKSIIYYYCLSELSYLYQIQAILLCKQNIMRLYISMYDFVPVTIVQGFHHLLPNF